MTDIKDMDKDQLFAYAKENFNVDLDLRRTLANLREDVNRLSLRSPTVAKKEETVKENTKKFLLNRDNGRILPWTELLASHLTNAILCDENGNPQ